MAEEEHEALFHSFPCTDYYVQSPSATSHANTPDADSHSSTFLSPFPLESFAPPPAIAAAPCPGDSRRFILSNCSSSRGSNNSIILHDKKIGYDFRSHDTTKTECVEDHGLLMKATGIGSAVEEDDDDYDDVSIETGGRRGLRVLCFGYSSAWYCIGFQIVWRFVVSVGIALLVFFLLTRPSPPKMSVKMVGIREFVLGEGVDASGVATKILACNCSIDLEVENRSKYFGLHIRPPVMNIAFGRLTFATTQGKKLYIPWDTSATFLLNVGTKNKAMYGAGQAMEEMLHSGKGLPLLIHIRLQSSIQVVWSLIQPKFRLHADCLIVLKNTYDRRHHTQAYNSTCATTFYS